MKSQMGEERGSIAFFTTYRPPVPVDIFSCPIRPTSRQDELHMTDRMSYNYSGQFIPPAALKTILKHPKLASKFGSEADVDAGRLSGMVFVSERRDQLETLHIAIRSIENQANVNIFSFADVFGTFNGVRMEDSGCVAGDYLVYVTTKDDPGFRREPWTAVYKTNLKTGITDRLTPPGEADLNPSVSPSGEKIAVASFQKKGGWNGEIKYLETDIYVMSVKNPLERTLVVENGGWPTWGSDNVMFFHRMVGDSWGVYRADISNGPTSVTHRVTPGDINAFTPAAMDATKVAVATIRKTSKFTDTRQEVHYRHIEIFDSTRPQESIKITQNTRPEADHFGPFVIDGGKRIGYHRCRSDDLKGEEDIKERFHKLKSPNPDVGLFRVSGAFPSFSKDGSKLAFVDNEFKSVWIADSKGLRVVFETKGPDNIFSPVWNQNPEKDILYVCMGPSFNAEKRLDICAISDVSSKKAKHPKRLTKIGTNNAFPSTNKEGTKLVFRSTRHWRGEGHKNLYIMEDARCGDFEGAEVTRLTEGAWTDTHCQWSPDGDWIVFSSTRDKPKEGVPKTDNDLDPGYFAVFLAKVPKTKDEPPVVVRVVGSGIDLAGHVNHPFFSPDGKSIVVTADLAAVSVDPISLPFLEHSVRPYGDIFTIDINPDDIKKNKNVKKFKRITHTRFENSTASWTRFPTQDPNAAWNKVLNKGHVVPCPYYAHRQGGESWHMTGLLCIPKRCC